MKKLWWTARVSSRLLDSNSTLVSLVPDVRGPEVIHYNIIVSLVPLLGLDHVLSETNIKVNIVLVTVALAGPMGGRERWHDDRCLSRLSSMSQPSPTTRHTTNHQLPEQTGEIKQVYVSIYHILVIGNHTYTLILSPKINLHCGRPWPYQSFQLLLHSKSIHLQIEVKVDPIRCCCIILIFYTWSYFHIYITNNKLLIHKKHNYFTGLRTYNSITFYFLFKSWCSSYTCDC